MVVALGKHYATTVFDAGLRGNEQTSDWQWKGRPGHGDEDGWQTVERRRQKKKGGEGSEVQVSPFWAPMAWHLKHETLTIISCYLLPGNGREISKRNDDILKDLSSFVGTIKTPWIAYGGWNASPETMAKNRRIQQLGARVMRPGTTEATCFQGDSATLIDFIICSREAEHLIESFEPRWDLPKAPWKPHIAMELTLRTEAKEQWHMTLEAPRRFQHEARGAKEADPGSKRSRKKEEDEAKRNKKQEERRGKEEGQANNDQYDNQDLTEDVDDYYNHQE